MDSSSSKQILYEFGDFRLDARILRCRGERIPLQPKAVDTLLALVEQAGSVVDKEALMERVWPDTFVVESGLQRNISVLRKTLARHGGGGPYIETIARRGYRFLPQVTVREVAAEGVIASEPVPAVSLAEPRPQRRRLAPIAAAVVGIAALVLWFANRPEPVLDEPFRMSPITADPGIEEAASFSPDGQQVVFAWCRRGERHSDIFIKRLDASVPLRLTSDPAEEHSPAWSPDGSRIAFLRDIGGQRSAVMLAPPLGGVERTLAEVSARPRSGITWSPDGKSLAVIELLDGDSTPRPQLTIVDVNTGKKQEHAASLAELAEAYAPSFSPDGQQIAFWGSTGAWPTGVYSASRGSNGIERISSLEGLADGLAWTAGGEELVVGRFSPTRTRSLWRVNVKDGEVSDLALGENPSQPVVSADGSRVAFTERSYQNNVVRYSLDTGAKDEHFLASTRFDGNPQYSPDGSRIAFTSARSGDLQIWVCWADGSEVRQLSTQGGAGSPRWSPDGERIAFDSTARGDANIYVVGVSEAAAQQVADSEFEEAVPAWSPDGQWLYFTSNRSGSRQIWRAASDPASEFAPVQVTMDGGFYPAISPEGDYLYFAKERAEESSLWRMRLPNSEAEVVLPRLTSAWGNWQLAAGQLYFLAANPTGDPSRGERGWVVRRLELRSGRVDDVLDLLDPAAASQPAIGGPALSVSPDGRWVLSGQWNLTSDLMLVENFR